MIKLVSSRDTKLDQHIQISKCNTHINRVKGQKAHDHLNRLEKSLWQNSTVLFDKGLKKLGIDGTYLNIIKAINKLIANTVQNGKQLKSFPLKSGKKQGCPLSFYS
jgi:hypothetical protein